MSEFYTGSIYRIKVYISIGVSAKMYEILTKRQAKLKKFQLLKRMKLSLFSLKCILQKSEDVAM